MTGINLIISEHDLDITVFWSHEADWINLVQDYGIDFDDTNHPIPAFHCLCGSQFCRGNRSDILRHEWVSYSPFLILISSLNKIHISRALDGHYLKGCFLDEASCNSRRNYEHDFPLACMSLSCKHFKNHVCFKQILMSSQDLLRKPWYPAFCNFSSRWFPIPTLCLLLGTLYSLTFNLAMYIGLWILDNYQL